jgi:hypothetical protein
MIADGKIARLDPQKVIIAHERRIVKSQVVFIHDNLQKSLSYFSYFKNELDDSDILAELLLVATYEARNMMLKFNRSYNQGNINKDRERLHHSIGDNMYGNDYIKKKLKDIMSNLAIMKHSNYFHNIMG